MTSRPSSPTPIRGTAPRRRSRRLAGLAPALLLSTSACSGDPAAIIAPRWRYEAPAPAAPPGIGPERRVVVALSSGQGELVTLNEENGTKVEGPFAPAFPTTHSPVVTGTTIVIVSSIGKLVGYNLAGAQLFSAPDAPLGVTGPLALAPDGSIRVASTSGRLLGFTGAGEPSFDTAIGGAAVTALAVDGEGTCFAATDTGRVVGVDASGAITFDRQVDAPASGPSLGPGGRIAVGHLGGLTVFDGAGGTVFEVARQARVVGTRFLADGELAAWGEDGALEVYDAGGARTLVFAPGPPIYTPVVEVKNGKLAVLDSAGTAHLVTRAGVAEATFALGGPPSTEVAVGELGFVFITVGSTVRALDFAFE